MSFVTHLESAIDGTTLPADQVQTMHNDRPLWVRYDLEAVRKAVNPDDFAARPPTLWRYRELLPIRGEDKTITVQITQQVNVYGTLIIVLLIVALVLGIIVFGIRLSRRYARI